MIVRFLPLWICLVSAVTMAPLLFAQDSTAVATLTVPTLVPAAAASSPLDALPTESALADIIATGTFRAGVLYNAPPYSEFTLQGELRGSDIELLRLMATEWSSDIEFVQVTRQNALAALTSGKVHTVATALVHYRDAPDEIEFTQAYQLGRQAIMVSAESQFTAPAELANRAVAYVIGTRAEIALALWRDQSQIELDLREHLNLDRAFTALSSGDVDAVIGEAQALMRVTADYPELVRILAEPILREPRALAVRRHDRPLRQLLNRTIQLLTREQKLQILFREFFPDEEFPEDAVTLWEEIGEAVTPSQFPVQIEYAQQYMLPRIAGARVLRVGGLNPQSDAQSAAELHLSQLNSAIAAELAARWGMTLETVPGGAEQAAELLTKGAVDIVVGVKPKWQSGAQLDYSAPYLLHGDRLMTPKPSAIGGFNDLRGRIIGLLIGDESAQERAQAWADSINASVRFFRTSERGAAQTLLDFNNAHAIYADSLALVAHLEANPNRLQLTERWYSRGYYAIALPANDPDFRRLVDYTLYELMTDGTLYELTAPLLLSDELPAFATVPGPAVFAGLNLAEA